MKINILKIKNFKNLKDVEFDFSNQRIILFQGETGNGKSAIFDALAYVLTDSLDEKLIEYIRWGQSQFEIKCNFTHLNHAYDIEIIGGKTTKKTLVIDNDKNNPFLNSEATKKLAEIVDPILTRYSAISEQGKSTSLLTDTPSNRLKKLREILKINKIISASDLMKEDAKVEKDKVDKLQSEIQTLEGLKFIYMDLPILEDISKLENEFNILQEEKNKYDIDIVEWNRYNKELEKYEEAKRNIFILQKKIKDIEIEKEQISFKPDIIFDKNKYEEILDSINKIEINKLKYDQSVKEYENYIIQKNKLENSIIDYESKLNEIKLSRIKPISYTDEQIKELQNKSNDYYLISRELSNKLKLIEKGKCPVTQDDCNQIISLNKKDIIKEIDNIENKINNLIEEINVASQDKKRFEDENKEQDRLRNNKQVLCEEIDRIRNQLNSLIEIIKPENKNFDTEFKQLQDEKIKLDQSKKECDDIKEYNQKQNLKLNSLEVQIKAYMEQINSLNETKQPIEIEEPIFNNTNYEDIKLKINLHKQKQEEYNKVVKFNKELKQNEDETKDKINLLTNIIQDHRSKIRVLDESRNLLEKKFSGYLIEKGTLYIKEKMNEFFQRSYGRYKISLGQDKSSIDFFYSDGIHKETPCGIASGFERQIISVANRVALSGIQNLGILMLDEADSESSSIRSEMLYKTLLNEKFNQIFVITHKDNTQEYLSNQPNSGVYEIRNGSIYE